MTRKQDRLPGIAGDPAGGRAVARVRKGVDAQIQAQRRLGHLEDVDSALVALARTLADAIDTEHTSDDGSRFTVGALAGRLVPVLLELRGTVSHDADAVDAEFAGLVAAIRDAPRP